MPGNYTVVKADKGGYVHAEDVGKGCEERYKADCLYPRVKRVRNNSAGVCDRKNSEKHKIPFLLDVAQTAGSINIDAEKMNADMIAFPGHKGLMGPLGTGGLYVKSPEELAPLVTGGTGSNSESVSQPEFMPDKFHSGTMNTPAIKALGGRG